MNSKKEHTQLKKMDFFQAVLPEFEEVIKNKDYVYYGENNLFPQYLIELHDYSALHRTCITAKRDNVSGKGLTTENPEDEDRLMMANSYNSVYDVFKKTAFDMVMFGGYAIQVIYKEDRSLGISEFYHLDFSKIRSGKKNEVGVITEYYYSDDWSNIRKNPIKTIPAFNMLKTDEPIQMIYYNTYTPSQSYYPKVDYLASIQSINIDVEIKNFHLSNIQNSLNPSLFISFNNGIPSDEERQEMYEHLQGRYSGGGSGKTGTGAGAMFLAFSESRDTSPEVTQIASQSNDTLFQTVGDMVDQAILVGHRVTSPLLIGIRDTGGGLGSNKDEIEVAYNHWSNTVIKPIQRQLLEMFDKILFLRDRKPINIEVVQNKIIDLEQ